MASPTVDRFLRIHRDAEHLALYQAVCRSPAALRTEDPLGYPDRVVDVFAGVAPHAGRLSPQQIQNNSWLERYPVPAEGSARMHLKESVIGYLQCVPRVDSVVVRGSEEFMKLRLAAPLH